MREIADYLSNYTAPSAGYTYGRLKDDPGDGTGSGIVVATHNDFLYGLIAPIVKYKGAISDTAESETASDVMDSIERIAGVQNENVAEYVNTTTYAIDDHVMYMGLQFVSMVGSNVGSPPLDNPAKWLPCFDRNEAVMKWQKCDDIDGGFGLIHDVRSASYRQYFSWGKYNFGGANGRNFSAYGVHLDGTLITGVTALENIFKVGVAGQYHRLDIIAPDVLGQRTLIDTKRRAAMVIDAASGAERAAIGGVQADQMQGHKHESPAGSSSAFGTGGVYTVGQYGTPASLAVILTNTPYTDGTNGTPRTGTTTYSKNYSVGVKSILVLVEI